MRKRHGFTPVRTLRYRASKLLQLVGAVIIILLSLSPAAAVTPDEMLKDPVLEARARALSEQLRCMVCQNESIDASDASLAHDLRVLLRERITAGDSDQEVLDFLVARYGEFILLKPRFNAHTALLWLAPGIVLIVGGAIVFGVLRRRRPGGEATRLTGEEEATLEHIMADDR